MNVIIIGCEGFIGKNSCSGFKSKGHQVKGADIQYNSALSKEDFYLLNPNNPNFEEIFSKTEFDLCINASGAANVNYSFEFPVNDYILNTYNVLLILNSIRKFQKQCKFINLSSAAVYGNPKELPIKEDGEVNPLSPYGFHKRQSEELCKEYASFFDLRTCSVRIFSAYGPFLKKQIFWDLYQKSKASKEIHLFGTGLESRDFIFIEDLVDAFHLVANNSAFKGEVVNVANGEEILIKDAVRIFFEALDVDRLVVFTGNSRTGDPINWKADISKLRGWGFRQKFSLENGLTEYSNWLKTF